MADQLATPADLASLLQQDVDTATATLLIEVGTAVVQATVGQRLVQIVNDVVLLDLDQHDSSDYLTLPQWPTTAVSAVLIGALPVTDYSVQLRRNRIFRPCGWRSTLLGYPGQPSQVSVTYTHGYPAGDQRLQLARGAVLSLAGSAYGNPSGATREQIDDYSVQYEAAAARMDAAPSLAALLRRQYSRSAGSVLLVKS